MQKLVVNGAKKLYGTVRIHGSKNAILPILAATLLVDGKTVLHNCPDIKDVAVCEAILQSLGCKTDRKKDTFTVDAGGAKEYVVSEKLMREMRSSIVFLGAIASRFMNAEMSAPGGCELGPRPIDIHISSLKKLGVNIVESGGRLFAKADKIIGTDVTLPIPSVGATENLILAAVKSNGTTRIINAAREPEIEDLGNFLNTCGADIIGHGTSEITIKGVSKLTACEYTVISDRIVAETVMCAVAGTGGEVKIVGVDNRHLSSVASSLCEMGCKIIYDEGITVISDGRLNRLDRIETGYYPGFPTDAGSLILPLMSIAEGTSVFVENIFDNRFGVVDELKRMGASVRTSGKVAIIGGNDVLCGANVCATDLRAGAALVIAGLIAKGTSEISGVEYIDRGYASIEKTFRSLGAEIKRVK